MNSRTERKSGLTTLEIATSSSSLSEAFPRLRSLHHTHPGLTQTTGRRCRQLGSGLSALRKAQPEDAAADCVEPAGPMQPYASSIEAFASYRGVRQAAPILAYPQPRGAATGRVDVGISNSHTVSAVPVRTPRRSAHTIRRVAWHPRRSVRRPALGLRPERPGLGRPRRISRPTIRAAALLRREGAQQW